MCPSSGEDCCIYATLVFVTQCEWRLVCWTDATHTEWQILVSHRYSNVFLMMGTWMPETCREEKWINILNRIVRLVGFIYEISQMHFSRLHTIFLVYVLSGCAVKKIPPFLFPSSALFKYLHKVVSDWLVQQRLEYRTSCNRMNDKVVCENEWWKFHYNSNVLKDPLLRPQETRVSRETQCAKSCPTQL